MPKSQNEQISFKWQVSRHREDICIRLSHGLILYDDLAEQKYWIDLSCTSTTLLITLEIVSVSTLHLILIGWLRIELTVLYLEVLPCLGRWFF